MEKDEILNMPAGREMDVLIESIQTRVIAHYPAVYQEWVTRNGDDGGEGFYCPRCGASDDSYGKEPCALHYSTDIRAAWEVVEKFKDKSPGIWLTDVGEWRATFSHRNALADIVADADTAPLAICRAALLAVMETA